MGAKNVLATKISITIRDCLKEELRHSLATWNIQAETDDRNAK